MAIFIDLWDRADQVDVHFVCLETTDENIFDIDTI